MTKGDIVTYFDDSPDEPLVSCKARVEEVHENDLITMVVLTRDDGLVDKHWIYHAWCTRERIPRAQGYPAPRTWLP